MGRSSTSIGDMAGDLHEHMIEVHFLDPTGYGAEAERVAAHDKDHRSPQYCRGGHDVSDLRTEIGSAEDASSLEDLGAVAS